MRKVTLSDKEKRMYFTDTGPKIFWPKFLDIFYASKKKIAIGVAAKYVK